MRRNDSFAAETVRQAAAQRAAAFVLGVPLVVILFRFYGVSQQPVVFWMALLAAAGGIYRAAKVKARSTVMLSLLFAILLAASQVIGKKISFTYSLFYDFTKMDYLVYFPALTLLFYAAATAVTDTVIRHPIAVLDSFGATRATPGRLFWLLSSAAVAVCWLPALFYYYPGILSGDSMTCLCRAMGIAPISNQQPALYQVILIPFVWIGRLAGDINIGVACYSLAQLLVMALIVGYALSWLRRQGCPMVIVVLVFLYFVLNPVFSAYAVTMWKDILFGGIMLLYVLALCDIVKSHGENLKSTAGLLYFLVLNLLVAFFRNNGIFVIACVLFVLAIYLKVYFRRLVPAFLAAVILVGVVQGPVYKTLHVTSSPFAESVGIPLQQIGRTLVKNGEVTDEELAFINKMMPAEKIKKVYWAFTADKIKFDKEFNNPFLEQNKPEFFRVWAGMLIPNIKEYCKAYAMETYGFWYIGIQNWIIFDGVKGYGGQTYGVTSRNLLLEWTGRDYRKAMWTYFRQLDSLPVTAPLFSVAVPVWAVLLSAFILIMRRRVKYLLPILPLAVLWLTIMVAAPTYCEYRYMFSFSMALPFILLLAFFKEKVGSHRLPASRFEPRRRGGNRGGKYRVLHLKHGDSLYRLAPKDE